MASWAWWSFAVGAFARSSASRCLAVFLSQSMLGWAGRACGMAHLLSLRPATAALGQKEGDISSVLEVGSTLYAVRRSPARPSAAYIRRDRAVNPTQQSRMRGPSVARRLCVVPLGDMSELGQTR